MHKNIQYTLSTVRVRISWWEYICRNFSLLCQLQWFVRCHKYGMISFQREFKIIVSIVKTAARMSRYCSLWRILFVVSVVPSFHMESWITCSRTYCESALLWSFFLFYPIFLPFNSSTSDSNVKHCNGSPLLSIILCFRENVGELS